MTSGFVVLVAALAVATAFGLWRRRVDGAVREVEFLAPMSVSILSQHRRVGPSGLLGGQPGSPGRQFLIRTDGAWEALGAIDSCEVNPGDRLIVETPGGGGYGGEE